MVSIDAKCCNTYVLELTLCLLNAIAENSGTSYVELAQHIYDHNNVKCTYIYVYVCILHMQNPLSTDCNIAAIQLKTAIAVNTSYI